MPQYPQLCDHCRRIATTREKAKEFTQNKGVVLCRGTRESVETSGCALRQITWSLIEEWNAERLAEERQESLRANQSFSISDPDPPISLMAWSGPTSEGKEWYDIDEMHFQYHWVSPRGGSSMIGAFDAYALPGKVVLAI